MSAPEREAGLAWTSGTVRYDRSVWAIERDAAREFWIIQHRIESQPLTPYKYIQTFIRLRSRPCGQSVIRS
jgi:hypothetical protein